MTTTKITGRIEIIERLPNSHVGNPRFAITLADADHNYVGTWNTAANHSFAYEITNRGRRVGSTVTLTIGGRGTIVALEGEDR